MQNIINNFEEFKEKNLPLKWKNDSIFDSRSNLDFKVKNGVKTIFHQKRLKIGK